MVIDELVLAAIIAATPLPAQAPEDYTGPDLVEPLANTEILPDHYVTTARITTYCPACNEPAGYGSASGKTLAPGDCACNWLPLGTVISIDGETFTVVDICGTDAIDLFIDDGSGVCHCNINRYEEVVVYE